MSQSDIPTVEKVMYFPGSFMRKNRKAQLAGGLSSNSQLSQEIAKIFDFDIVLVPFFYEEPDRGNQTQSTYRSNDTGDTPTTPGDYDGSGTVLVSIQTKSLQIDLFNRAGRESIDQENSEAKN